MDNIDYINEIDKLAEMLKAQARETASRGLQYSMVMPILLKLWRIHTDYETAQLFSRRRPEERVPLRHHL